jgi:hypothetical protein
MGISVVKAQKLDEFTSWTQVVICHNAWTVRKKVTPQKLSILQGPTTDILLIFPGGATYEDIIGALKGRWDYYQLVAAYRSQIKTTTWTSGIRLQEFAAPFEQLVHRALVGII